MPVETLNRISLEEVKEQATKSGIILYGASSCWWAHTWNSASKLEPSGIPCDPRGGVLFQTEEVAEFFDNAEANSGFYGRHGLAAFMAAHHYNSVANLTARLPWCCSGWEEYNLAVDRLLIREQQQKDRDLLTEKAKELLVMLDAEAERLGLPPLSPGYRAEAYRHVLQGQREELERKAKEKLTELLEAVDGKRGGQ